MSTRINRRAVLAGFAALPAFKTMAQEPFSKSVARANALRQLRTLVISQGGEIRRAEAFRGPGLDVPVNVKSVSKSVVSALTGIAIQRGEIANTETLVAPLLRRTVPRRADPRVKDITVGHMLSMQSGLQEVSGAAYGEWVTTRHWIYEALSKPMISDPGTDVHYSTASYHVLGAVLSRVGGMDLHQLARTRLGGPLNIQLPPWTQDPQGRYLGGNDMRMSPLAMVRFGEMYRNRGRHRGNPVLTPEWIDQSWTVLGHSKETGHGYGFGWFIWNVDGHDVFYARGYGGQMIFIVPKLELTCAITSNPGLPATLDGHLGDIFAIFTEAILPEAVNS